MHCGEALAGVVALEVLLLLLEQALLACVAVERPGEGGLEAGEVRAALGRVDVVREREHRLDVGVVPLHRDLDLALLAVAFEVDDVLVHGVLGPVDVRDEVADAALVVELLGLPAGALVPEDDPQPAREERGLAQTLCERRRVELRLLEDLGVREERDRRAGLVLRGDADLLHVPGGLATCELLPVELAVAADLGDQPLRERVHDGDADSVQPSRDLVAVAAELAAGVELRQHDGERRHALIRDHVDGDARPGVLDGDRVVGMDRDVDEVVSAREGLVDGVVDDLVDEVMKASRSRRPDVHTGSKPDRLEAFQDRDVLCGIGCFGQ